MLLLAEVSLRLLVAQRRRGCALLLRLSLMLHLCLLSLLQALHLLRRGTAACRLRPTAARQAPRCLRWTPSPCLPRRGA